MQVEGREASETDWVPEFCDEVGQYVRDLGELLASGAPQVREIFRLMHTIKGAAGLSGLSEMERLGHAAELALDGVRASQGALDPRLRHALSVTTAVMDRMLESLADRGETGASPQRLLRTLHALGLASRPPPTTNIGTLLQQAGLIDDHQLRAARLTQLAGDRRRIGEILVDSGHVDAPALQSALARQAASLPGVGQRHSAWLGVGYVETLVWIRAELRQVLRSLANEQLEQPTSGGLSRLERLEAIARQLEQIQLEPPARPIKDLFAQVEGSVARLAQRCSKQVRCEFSGGELVASTEVVEALMAALIHLIRNALDHGIETPSDRVALGKPETGVFGVHASRASGALKLRISDDGRGIDVARLVASALERGLIDGERAGSLDLRERLDLVFIPGLSTAASVTALSGMGVGMDAVLGGIAAAGGGVRVESEVGKGTTVWLEFTSEEARSD